MRLRSATTVGLAVAAVLAGTSHAAPKLSCNLVTDPAGDVNNAPAFPEDAGLDIVGGDVATNAKSVTAVIRLANDPGSASPLYVKRFILQFSAKGLKYPAILAAGIAVDGTSYLWGYYGPNEAGQDGYNYGATEATGSINGKEISITAPLADMAADENLGAIKPGAKISELKLISARRLPGLAASPRGQLAQADDATGKKTYTAGAASCIKVG